ncbi:447_t:CDS:10 [Paraglomus occultum]|uniref:447_t:CDS:1 n=1 Tax=Paraglomus occultum TaxID=144539 RepID=A0A9N8VDP6_9GLOM|nr:447_t:CDS:10 [Paraglomus occultum]
MNYDSTRQKDCTKTGRYDEFATKNNVIKPVQIIPHNKRDENPKTPDSTLFLDMTSEEEDDYSCLCPRQTTLSGDDCSKNRAATQSIRNMDAYWARFRLPRNEWLQKEWNRGGSDRTIASNANNLINKSGGIIDNASHANANIFDNSTVNYDNTIVDNVHDYDDSSSVDSSTNELGMSCPPSLYPTSTTLENKISQKRKDFIQKYSFSLATDKKQKTCEESTESEVLSVDNRLLPVDSEEVRRIEKIRLSYQRIRISSQSPTLSPPGSFGGSIIAVLTDDFANAVKIGQFVEIIGFAKRHFHGLDANVYRVNNTIDTGVHVESLNNHDRLMQTSEYFTLLQSANLSAWSFTQRVVDVFCEDVAPTKAYRKIKLCLLLSLISISEKPVKHINSFNKLHLLIICDKYNNTVRRLLRHVSNFTRHEEWTYGIGNKRQPLFSVEYGEKKPRSEAALESTILSRVDDGILLVDMETLSKKDVNDVRQVMTPTSQPTLETQYHQLCMDIDACLWAWSTTRKTTTKGKNLPTHKDVNQYGVESSCKADCRETVDSETSNSLINHVFDQYSENGKLNGRVSLEDFKSYIVAARSIEVTLSKECKDLLRKYYLTFRKLKGGSHGYSSSTALLETLLTLAICHAKLCLRSVGSLDDALASVLLVEESIATKYGSSRSLLGFSILCDDQENLHNLYGVTTDEDEVPETNEFDDCETNDRRLQYFYNLSRYDDEKMSKMYQHLLRIFNTLENDNAPTVQTDTRTNITASVQGYFGDESSLDVMDSNTSQKTPDARTTGNDGDTSTSARRRWVEIDMDSEEFQHFRLFG